MSVWEKHPTLKSMLEHGTHLLECQVIFSSLQLSELQEVQNYIINHIKNVEKKLWNTRKQHRLIEAQKHFLKQDKTRIEALFKNSQIYLQKGLGKIFSNPQLAFKKIQQCEHKHGLSRTSYILKNSPSEFGDIKGINLLGLHLFGRSKAINIAQNLEYERLKSNYAQSYKVLQWINNIIGEEKAA